MEAETWLSCMDIPRFRADEGYSLSHFWRGQEEEVFSVETKPFYTLIRPAALLKKTHQAIRAAIHNSSNARVVISFHCHGHMPVESHVEDWAVAIRRELPSEHWPALWDHPEIGRNLYSPQELHNDTEYITPGRKGSALTLLLGSCFSTQ